MTRTFWMSFAEEEGFRGVCVIDVTEADVEACPRHPRATDEAWANPETRWLATAHRLSWQRGCNPGGQIRILELDPATPWPRDRLLFEPELKQLGIERDE